MNAWKKVWPAVGVVCALLSACGGGGGDSSTSTTQSSSVGTSDTSSTTVASTLDFNVSQVFANWYGTASSLTVSGQVTGQNADGTTETANLQVTFKTEPLADGVFNGQAAKRSFFLVDVGQWGS
jgi:hypothetical protein